MVISKKMNEAINKQINRELFSAYLYLSAAAFLDSKNFEGAAHWMKKQFGEEQGHAMKFYNFVIERNGAISLGDIEKPKSDWKSMLDIFTYAYEHEQKVTEMIFGLLDIAKAEKDYSTEEFLQWFIKEQVEEEANASKIVDKLKLVGDNIGGLFIIDSELGKRE
jgi:ferritin